LRADASGAAAFVLDQHALDQLAVPQLEQQLVRVVAGAQMLGDATRQRNERLRQLLPQRFGQVRHRLERIRPGHE
jgi:CBS-domain-containing membrane protein